MRCPDCRAETVAAASAVWAQGTARIDATTAALLHAHGTTTTVMAAAAGPPVKPALFWPCTLMLGLGIGLALMISTGVPEDARGLVWGVCLLLAFAGMAVTATNGQKDYAAQADAWRGRWMCLRCGHADKREAFEAEGPRPGV